MITFFKNIINAIRRLFGAKEEQKEVDVPQGLQVWDENGGIQIDTTTRTSIFIGEIELTPSSKSATISSNLFGTNTPFYVVLRGVSHNRPLTGISTSSTSSSYTVSAQSVNATSVKIIIGVY